jgi:hypothetical protein
MTLTTARLRAWAERLDFYARHLLPGDFRREQFETIAREMREAAGEEEPYCDVCGESGASLRTPVEVCRDCYDLARDPSFFATYVQPKAAGEDAREDGAPKGDVVRLSPAEAPCEPAISTHSCNQPELCGRFLADHHEPTRCVLPKGHAPVCSSVTAEPELWGVWCVRNGLPGFWRLSGDLQKRIEVPEAQARLVARLANDPHENTHARDGWRYEARPIPRGNGREATRAEFRAQAAKAGPPPVSMLAVEANTSPLPTEAGHYELTPSGEWRKVERSGE